MSAKANLKIVLFVVFYKRQVTIKMLNLFIVPSMVLKKAVVIRTPNFSSDNFLAGQFPVQKVFPIKRDDWLAKRRSKCVSADL